MAEEQRASDRVRINPKARCYYERLGVSRGASREEIQRAFRKAARLYHPDLAEHLSREARAGREENFKAINEAWEVLGDDEDRKRYDELGFEAFSGKFHPRNAYANIESLFELILAFGNPFGAAQFILQVGPLLQVNPILKQRLVALAQNTEVSRSHLFGFVIRQAAMDVLATHLKSADELVDIFETIVRNPQNDVASIRTYAILALKVRACERRVLNFLQSLYSEARQNFHFWKVDTFHIFFPDPGYRDITAAALEALGGAASGSEIRSLILDAAENASQDHPLAIQKAAGRALKDVISSAPNEYLRVIRLIEAQRYQPQLSPAVPEFFRSLVPVSNRPEVRAQAFCREI